MGFARLRFFYWGAAACSRFGSAEIHSESSGSATTADPLLDGRLGVVGAVGMRITWQVGFNSAPSEDASIYPAKQPV